MRGCGEPVTALAGEGDRPEFHKMRALDQRFDRLSKRLDRLAKEIAVAPAQTVEGILLKIEIALTFTDPAERKDPPWSLVESALNDLRRIA